jgi:divalent metal cation (Fe/Co/Zn/Cd) transporter
VQTRSIAARPAGAVCASKAGCGAEHLRTIGWLQGITIVWMLIECAVALIAAARAHSPVLFAFGSDSLVELLSAAVVVLQFTPTFRIRADKAARIAGMLLFGLAGLVILTSIASLALHIEPDRSWLGIGITLAALIVMPVLSAAKQHMAEKTGNVALAADSVQSATCAYLALITLVGLAANAIFHLPWVDAVAALGVTPILIVECRHALRGESCGCC